MNDAEEIFKNILKGTANEKKLSTSYVQKKWGVAESALAGWWFGGTLEGGSSGTPSPSEQREFERQLSIAEQRRGRRIRKDMMLKLQKFYQ